MPPPPAEQLAARIFAGPALRAQPDRRLVELVRKDCDAAFEEIVRRYRRRLDRFAAAIVGGHAEDVTQDAFSKALPALRGSEAEIELRPWLYRIVRNTALNDLRDRAPAAAELSEHLPGGRGADAEVLAREELADLTGRLRALPEPQRAALVMRELEGLSHEEIAAALGVSGGAARQAIHRARTALRDGIGLLVPLPVLQALAERQDEAAGAGGAVAAGAASSAGGAALGGLGGGALKAGVATVLIAGAVGAGLAVKHGGGSGPAPAKAAPLARDARHGSPHSGDTGFQRRSAAGTRDPGGERGPNRGAGGGGASAGGGRRSGSPPSGNGAGDRGGTGPSSGSGGGGGQGGGAGESGNEESGSGESPASGDGASGGGEGAGGSTGDGGTGGETESGSGEPVGEAGGGGSGSEAEPQGSGEGSSDLSGGDSGGSNESPVSP